MGDKRAMLAWAEAEAEAPPQCCVLAGDNVRCLKHSRSAVESWMGDNVRPLPSGALVAGGVIVCDVGRGTPIQTGLLVGDSVLCRGQSTPVQSCLPMGDCCT
jgi:hypothetical protein